MAKDVLEQLCDLLKSPEPELQCAAARVIGALKIRDAAPRRALTAALRSESPMVVAYAVDALGRLGDPSVLADLVEVFAAPQAARDRALAAVAAFGSDALPPLREALKAKDPAVRRGAVEAFARIPGDAPLDGLLEAIQDADEEVVQQATAAVRKRIEGMGEKEREAFLGRVRKLLDRPGIRKSVPAAAALMKMLGFLRRPAAVPVLLGYLDRKLPLPVRKNALLSLAHLEPAADAKAVVDRVLPLLAEADFTHVVSPALSVLWKVKIPKAYSAKVLALQKSPHAPVRAFAVRALGSVGTAQAADALLAGLASADFRDRELAAGALRENEEFAPRLAAALEKAKDLTFAWTVAGVLRGFRGSLDKRLAKRLLGRGVAYLSKQDEERAKAFIEVARHASPELTRGMLLQQGVVRLRRKKFEAAEAFLRYLERDELSTPEGVYALALARFKRGGASLEASAHGKNPALPLFARLLRLGGFPVAKRLTADRRLLTPGELLYLGFHFVEQQGTERTFGGEALKTLVKAFPKSPEAKSAKQRLSTEGMG